MAPPNKVPINVKAMQQEDVLQGSNCFAPACLHLGALMRLRCDPRPRIARALSAHRQNFYKTGRQHRKLAEDQERRVLASGRRHELFANRRGAMSPGATSILPRLVLT